MLAASFSSDCSRVVARLRRHRSAVGCKTGASVAHPQRAPIWCSPRAFPRQPRRRTQQDGTARLWDAKDRGLFAHPPRGTQFGARRELFSRRQPRRRTRAGTVPLGCGMQDRGLFAHPQGPHQFGARHELFSRWQPRRRTSSDSTARLWDARRPGPLCSPSRATQFGARRELFSRRQPRRHPRNSDGTARLWDAKTRASLLTLGGTPIWCSPRAFPRRQPRRRHATPTAPLGTMGCKDRGLFAHPQGAHQFGARRELFSRQRPRRRAAPTAPLGCGMQRPGGLFAHPRGHTNWVRAASFFSRQQPRRRRETPTAPARLWDAKTGASLLTLRGTNWVRAAGFSPDGSRVVTAKRRRHRSAVGCKDRGLFAHPQGGTNLVRAASFSPDGSRVVAVDSDGTARLWDAKTGASLLTLKGHTIGCSPRAFLPTAAASSRANDDGTAFNCGMQRPGPLCSPSRAHTNLVRAASFSPAATASSPASSDGTARLWDAKTGASLLTLRAHQLGASRELFSRRQPRRHPKRRHRSALWDAKRPARTLITWADHQGAVNAAAFSPNGEQVVTLVQMASCTSIRRSSTST